MAESDAQDRNLPASARRLKKAREDGNVPRSRDLGHFAALAAGGLGLVAMTPTLIVLPSASFCSVSLGVALSVISLPSRSITKAS